MASIAVPSSMADRTSWVSSARVVQWLTAVLTPLASLRLTVVLFALSIVLVLVGTLAQVEMDIWQVVHTYFRSWFCMVPLRLFVPRTWFPDAPAIPGAFPFVGGKALGVALAINLLAAHLIRFRVQAKGMSLVIGVLVTLVGAALTTLVIRSGHSVAGVQDQLPWSVEQQWTLMRYCLVGVAALLVPAWYWTGRERTSMRWMLLFASLVLAPATTWALWQGATSPFSGSSMRILWQLAQALLAGTVLLVGCAFLFRKRAGIVLLHSGVALLMFYEFYVDLYAVEGQMTMVEGQTVDFARDIRSTELALIDSSHPERDRVVVVPVGMLMKNARISHDDLPVDLKVLKYYPNATLISLSEAQHTSEPEGLVENLATTGVGLRARLVERRPGTGVDAYQEVDLAAAYVTAYRKGTDESLGTFLLSQEREFSDQYESLEVDGRRWDMALRFKHMYKPYQMTLRDVRKDDYVGTNTPMNYSSDVRLVDSDLSLDRDVHIWMNNPLRYRGETFYQSNYFRDETGREYTVLQVVTNTGWMMPYISCILVLLGMATQFLLVLVRFLDRRSRPQESVEQRQVTVGTSPVGWREWAFTLVMVALMAGMLISKSRPRELTVGGMRLDLLGQLPAVYEGRVKPLDTLARNMLARVADSQTFKDEKDKSQPAIRWLADVIAGQGADRDYRVFRISSIEVLDTLKLPRRHGFRYSLNEIVADQNAFHSFLEQADQAQALGRTNKEKLTLYQRQLLELDSRLRTYQLLRGSFMPIDFPPLPTPEQVRNDQESARATLMEILTKVREVPLRQQQLAAMQPPLVVWDPAKADDSSKGWMAFASAVDMANMRHFEEFTSAIAGHSTETKEGETPAATVAWTQLMEAYGSGNVTQFNPQVERMLSDAAMVPADLDGNRLNFEYRLEQTQPFVWCQVVYLVALALALLGWIGWPGGFHRAAFWLLLLGMAVHTFALVARIYISGRPPVTNLYSAAVFVGWGCVLLGLLIEYMYRLGLGALMGGAMGFASLIIANGLSMRGDTMAVLQAVLDTQFWLATHVVTVTLGYSATFAAGGLGALYVAAVAARYFIERSKVRLDAMIEVLPRIIYGVLCFALLLSFVGTVLGGLWADDSWGRFWGWDPKENGALIIVLWNALLLHARWGGMVRGPGLALLAVAGNITTAWSMFGVNELGVGLHSYGVTEGTLRTLALFCIIQLILIAGGGLLIIMQRRERVA